MRRSKRSSGLVYTKGQTWGPTLIKRKGKYVSGLGKFYVVLKDGTRTDKIAKTPRKVKKKFKRDFKSGELFKTLLRLKPQSKC